jgi:Cytochrome c biogenesis factor
MKLRLFSLLIVLYAFQSSAQEQLLNLARQYLLSGEYEKSLSAFRHLLEYNPNDEEIRSGYLQSLIGLKDFNTAEKLLRQRLKLSPHSVNDRYDLAQIYFLQGETKKAEKEFEKIIKAMPADDSKIRELATRFSRDSHYDWAIKTYEKGKDLLSQTVSSHIRKNWHYCLIKKEIPRLQ